MYIDMKNIDTVSLYLNVAAVYSNFIFWCFLQNKKWLSKIKQALTIYKEDIKQKLNNFKLE